MPFVKDNRKDAPQRTRPMSPEEAKKSEERRQRITEMIRRNRSSLPVPPEPESDAERPPVWDHENHYWTRTSSASGRSDTWDFANKRWVDKDKYDEGERYGFASWYPPIDNFFAGLVRYVERQARRHTSGKSASIRSGSTGGTTNTVSKGAAQLTLSKIANFLTGSN